MTSSPSPVDLFGFGHCCADYLAVLRPFPEKGKKGDVIQSLIVGGGPVPTACQCVSKWGKSVRFVGKVGDDSDGRMVVQGLIEEGIEASGMLIDPTVTTARAYIWIDPLDGSRTVALDASRFHFPGEDELDVSLPAACRIFLADGRAADATIKSMKIARESGATTILDAGAARPRFREMLALTDYAIVSRDVADTFAPGATPEELARLLVEAGVKVAVVTIGERGAIYRGSEGVGLVAGFEVSEVFDTTGAGDVFHGGFVYGLLEGWPIERRLRFASAAAALSTKKLSGRFSIPSLGEVEEFLRQSIPR